MKKTLAFLYILLIAQISGAQLLVQETWDYGIGSSPSTWNGGTGFSSSAWNPNLTGAVITNGLTFGSMPVSGGSVYIPYTAAVAFSSSTLSRQMNISSLTSGDLWMAYLFKFDTDRSTLPDNEALEIRPGAGSIRTGINETSSAVRLRYGSDTTTSGTDSLVKSGQTLLYVTKFPDLGSTVGSDAKGWLLTEADYNSIASGGITETELDAAASLRITNSFAANTTVAGNVSLEFAPIGRNSSTPSFFVDEFRIGRSVEDVVAIAPPSLKLIVISGL